LLARRVREGYLAGKESASENANQGGRPMFGLGIIGTILLILLILWLIGVL
jgi:hypothetical protein